MLRSGREIWTHCYIVSDSTRGALLYTPSERATRNFIRVAENEGRTLFGDHPVFLVPPRITNDREDRPCLPPVRFVGDFSSAQLNDANDLSSAIDIWYQESTFPIIGDDVRDAFVDIAWKNAAKDEKILP